MSTCLGITFIADDIKTANDDCVALMQKIDVRAPQYRHDIGKKFVEKEIKQLKELGYL